MSDYERELEIAARIAREAGRLVRGYRGRKLVIESKAGNEPVTEADRAASALIVGRLAEAFPDDVILSEEVPDDRKRLGRRRVWMVDPIDGTSDFILGDDGFVVMIGLAVDGRPAVGAVAHPLSDKVYAGVVGQRRLDGVGRWRARAAAHVHARPPAEHPPGRVQDPPYRPRRRRSRRRCKITDEMNVGSVGLKIGLVSEAIRDLYVYTGGRTKIWDTCGPEAILLGAGGKMTDVDGTPLVYDQPDLYNRRGIVASNGPLHGLVIATLAPLVTATD